MHSIPELNDSRLYDLLEAGAEQARSSVRLLGRLIADRGKTPEGLTESVERSAKIADDIRVHLLDAIVTSLPKSDIETLSRTTAAIPVIAQRFAQRYGLAADIPDNVSFAPALDWIEELGEIMLDTVRQLRGFESLDRIKELYQRLEKVADRAEALVQESVNHAYEDPAKPLDVMKVRDLGDQLVEIIERCSEAGGLMNSISLRFL